jgi:cytochrome c-type biogenesis protein CcmH
MNRNSKVKQGAKMKISNSRILLISAAALALVSIGYRIGQNWTNAATALPGSQPSSPTNANPSDPAALQALGLERYGAEDFAGAAAAYEKAVALNPKNALLWSALGEARVMASPRDPLPAPALAAFRKAIELDAKDPRARYFLAVKRDLDGDHKGAIADWLALLKDTPLGAPWEADLKRTIEQVGKINKIDTARQVAELDRQTAAAPPIVAAVPGPSAADLQAATAMSPSEQRKMAEDMVARLEGKLKAAPANPQGWVMLIRSRVNLGQPDKAAQALKDAVTANPAQADFLRQQAEVLGVR